MIDARIKFAALGCLFLYAILNQTDYTAADMFAERMIRDNQFKVVSLDLLVSETSSADKIESLFNTSGLKPGGFDIGAVNIQANGEKTNYRLTALMAQDNPLCEALNIEIYNRRFNKEYSGPLSSLSFDSILSDNQAWIYVISFIGDEVELKGQECDFEFKYRTEGERIFAERRIHNLVKSGLWE
ncbi:hypothetical protein CVU83_00055 [Candidatus Falkowbacteria bacterium HGW-Falkowbacteria-2]|uniref:Uncharacterized protein n=1 Tax=Candidatus Falkowbacteria bacterium HGW-Falkowbacteria-2 TaxID=2013769 RepID=A0A2N2E3V9_9BACT|nr:MAG: hypothetical protein CVU83_00055 [Candidatus Falkowbacteria bacterium HGW-Falkowbacteria-2]